MAYNISDWTTKRIEGLVIPLIALYGLDERLIKQGWQPSPPVITAIADGGVSGVSIEIHCTDTSVISGRSEIDSLITEASIAVEAIKVYGEGSATFYYKVLLPALKQSKGELEAVLIWEGGDSISRLVVKDGEVTEPKVEL